LGKVVKLELYQSLINFITSIRNELFMVYIDLAKICEEYEFDKIRIKNHTLKVYELRIINFKIKISPPKKVSYKYTISSSWFFW
jgi:cob(I)alamin adenosyltransferase